MDSQRKVKIVSRPIYQGDSGVDEFCFELDRRYGEIDLSELSACLKITYPDDSGDVIDLEKQVFDDSIKLTWKIDGKNTQIAGECEGQVLFENNDNTVIFNSEVFKIEIKNSVNSTFLHLGGKTYVELLLERVNEKISEVDDVLNSKIVNSVNGFSGDVVIQPEHIGAVRIDEFDTSIDKFKNGEYVVKKAECDSSGDNISSSYVKKSDLEWRQVAYSLIPQDEAIELNLGGRYKELFAVMELPVSVSLPNLPVLTRIETKIGSNYVTIYHIEESDLTLYSDTYHVSYKFNMCANFAKVEKQQACLDMGDDMGLLARSTVGKDVGQSYIDNLRIRFFDESGKEVYANSGWISVYGLKHLG